MASLKIIKDTLFKTSLKSQGHHKKRNFGNLGNMINYNLKIHDFYND
jgi:hypothetical protein